MELRKAKKSQEMGYLQVALPAAHLASGLVIDAVGACGWSNLSLIWMELVLVSIINDLVANRLDIIESVVIETTIIESVVIDPIVNESWVHVLLHRCF
jgi:hypothetical protein